MNVKGFEMSWIQTQLAVDILISLVYSFQIPRLSFKQLLHKSLFGTGLIFARTLFKLGFSVLSPCVFLPVY